MHGKDSSGKKSDYAKQLREKQKAKRIFGVSERQIQRYYEKALASKEESGAELLRQMERRFDNIVFRCGFASTRRQARQFVTHGILTLNGKRANVPSLQLKEGDTFTVKQKNTSMPVFVNFAAKKITPPKWLKVEGGTLIGQVIGRAEKEDLEGSIAPEMIIEFYSR